MARLLLLILLVLASCKAPRTADTAPDEMPPSLPMPPSPDSADMADAAQADNMAADADADSTANDTIDVGSGADMADSSDAAAVEALPPFPWPPPAPSATARIDRARLGGARMLDDVDTRLTRALARTGYTETGRFRAPGGFALVTRMERIEPDGRSWRPAGRFDLAPRAAMADRFTLASYFDALFRAPPGHYRVIAFIVSDRVVVPSGRPIGYDTATSWPDKGGDGLTPDLAVAAFSPRHRVTALVYEFVRTPSRPAAQVKKSGIQGSDHLGRAGITRALGG